jgi:hypothetical protein
MKLRSFQNLLAAIAGGLLVLGTVGLIWILAQSPLGLLKGSAQAEPTAAVFVPKQAPVMASLLVNPDRLQTLWQLVAKPGDRAAARKEFDQFKQGILGSSELDYGRDVQPWLGDEITAAITALDFDRDPTNGQQPGYLLALQTKDTERSREFLQLFWQKRAIAGSELAFDAYQGTKIIYGKVANQENSAPLTLASAVVGKRYVLFANSPKVLRDAINNVQTEELSLVNSEDYQHAIAALDRGRIGVVFLNVPELAALNGQEFTGEKTQVAIALGLDRQGAIAETAILGGNALATQITKQENPVEALNYVPAVSSIVASGQDLNQLWTGISESATQYGRIASVLTQPIETVQQRWSLDLPKEIFQWVKGDYALGLLPRDPGKETTSDWVFVADKSTDPNAEAAIAHLDELAKSQEISTGTLKLGGQPISVWTRLATANSAKVDAEVIGAHTSIGKYEIFTTSIPAMNAVLNAKKDTLANSKTLAQAIAPLQKPNNGYLYIDWDTAQPILESRLPLLKVLELAGQPFFEHLRSLTISNYGNPSGIQRGGVFIQLS